VDYKEEEEDLGFASREQEYIHWHNKLGRISHTRLRQLAKSGWLPKYLAKINPPPVCAACIHGKMTKTPWRVKGEYTQTPRAVTRPGECVAVDQLESTTPGFVGQLKGQILTKVRYRYAAVFVDLYSDYTYVHFHANITSEETVRAKQAFETHLRTYGVTVLQYHVDNGRFQDKLFKLDCESKNQQLSFCGVNAHYQNGRAEKKIQDLQDSTRTSLLHAMRKRPQAVIINLWP
jgi:hypothetical protein